MRTLIFLFFVHSGNKVANRTIIYLHYGPEKIRNYTISEADEPKEEIDRNRGFNIYVWNGVLAGWLAGTLLQKNALS